MAQEPGYFCNAEHICSQPQRRSNCGRRTGMQGARQGWGELRFHPFWQLGGHPPHAFCGRWGYSQQVQEWAGAQPPVVMVKV